MRFGSGRVRFDGRESDGSTRIDKLNYGLKTLEAKLKGDPTAKTHVQLAIVCVGGPADTADKMMDWICRLRG